MKRTIVICCMIILLIIPITVYSANIELNLVASNQNYTINRTGQKIEISIELGNFININEGTTLGYTATLNYDTSIFEEVTVTGENGWNTLYNEENYMIQGDTEKAKSNTKIAKIELTLKEENIKRNDITKIKLKDIIISDGNFEIKQDKEIEINLTNKTVEEKTQEITDIQVLTGENSKKAMASTQEDILPDVGLKRNIIIAIAILIIIMIIFRIKARKIK